MISVGDFSRAQQAARAWWPHATLSSLGNGHIHHTYLVCLEDDVSRFVLQSMNQQVFADPKTMTDQTALLLDHLAADRDYAAVLAVPELVPTSEGHLVYNDGHDVWRVWRYQEQSRVIDPFSSTQQIESAAKAFGAFQRSLKTFRPRRWSPSIPGFLQLAGYLRSYRQLLSDGAVPVELAQVIDAHQDLENALDGDQSFIHGDCKINNVLFKESADQALAVIDLDTTGLGHWAWDFGDLVRSVAFSNGALELDHFVACVRGFNQGRDGFEQSLDVTALQMSRAPAYIALTLGVRFVTDHLRGDPYFRVTARGENLHRARQQLELLGEFGRLQEDLFSAAYSQLRLQ
jgi:Ser/Thr protein kinase RdoA (MazF antagonist)